MGDVRVSDDLRDRVTEALTREHYRRARERIEASPEEHSAAMADVAMGVLTAQDVGELPMQIAQTAVVRPGDTLILRVPERARPQDAEQIRTAVREALPNVEVLLIGGVDEMVIYRPETPGFKVTVGDNVTPEQVKRFAEELERQIGSSVSWGRR